MGGLGNQMFQYAAGRRLAYISNKKLKLDISGFESYDLRKYELGNFCIEEIFATEEDLKRIGYPKSKFYKNMGGFISLFGRKKLKTEENKASKIYYYKEKCFQFDPDLFRQKNDIYLDGYWQSEKYFKDIEDIIKSDFTLKLDMSDSNAKAAKKILNSQSVSIHVRRGDYVSNSQAYDVHGVCSLDYYNRAISNICSKVAEPHFFVFSDEPKWAEENLYLYGDVDYISHNDPLKGYEDLRLMRLCGHHIIANSSFSWWGAWLAKEKGGIVIAPEKWFNKSKNNTKDLIPSSWNKL